MERQRQKQVRILSQDEIRQIIEASHEGRYGIVIQFILGTGARLNEALALRWSDVDFQENKVRIGRTLIRSTSQRYEFQKPKTKAGHRNIPIPSELAKLLIEHRREQDKERPNYESESDLVFNTADGKPVTPRLTTRYFSMILKGTGLPYVNIYDLRRTYIFGLVREGVSVEIIREYSGSPIVRGID